jgi:hypothetical protein
MNTTEQIILVILAAFLVLFLGLAIALTAATISVVKQIKVIVSKAESVVDSAESVTEVFRQASGPMALFKLIHNIQKSVKKRR